MGGAVQAIEAGFQMDEIEEAAYSYTKSIDDQTRVLVGVNKFTVDNEPEPKITPPIPGLEQGQVDRLTKYKANRDMALVAAKLDALREAAKGTGNVLHPMKEALRANATLGEVSDALRDVFGVYRPG
jgi:methylmalonyl-CoA mutase N-terminal domain/subunit